MADSFVMLLWLALVLTPLFVLLLGPLFFESKGDPWSLINSRKIMLLLSSLAISAAVAFVCTLMSLAATVWLRRLRGGRLAWLGWLPVMLIAVPPFIHGTAWQDVFQQLDLVMIKMGAVPLALPGWLLTVWVQSMAFLPVSMGFTAIALSTVDRQLLEACRVTNSEWRCLSRVQVPLATPTIMVGAGLVLLLSISDFSVPSFFSTSVYSLEIFTEYSVSSDATSALWVSFPLVLTCAGIVFLLTNWVKNIEMTPGQGSELTMGRGSYPLWFRLFQWFAVALIVLQFVVPVVTLLRMSGSIGNIIQSVSAASEQIANSVQIALLAALISVLLAWLLRRRLANRYWVALALLPIAVPGAIVGAGLIMAWNHQATEAVYQSALMPFFGAVARFAPFAALTMSCYARSISPALFEAADVTRGRGPATWLQIELPLLGPGLLAAFLIVFALTLGELPATVMVTPPQHDTVAMRIFSYVHYGAGAQVAGLCLFIAGSAMASFAAAIAVMSWVSKKSQSE